jgi:pyruvate,orthophosphate dikinase
MFNDSDRIPIVQEMILADTVAKRQAALDRLLPIQRADFHAIFREMSGLPVTVRLLDPPLHEFLPGEKQLQFDLARLREGGDQAELVRREAMLERVRQLAEVNPMLGHRGVRLGLTHPEIYAMQIRAILEAAAECVKEGVPVEPEIMVPQVATVEELARVKKQVEKIHREVEASTGVAVEYHFGTMMEVVRACLRAEDMAGVAEIFSFGTNDLTQATFSVSREDAENTFLPFYVEQGLLPENPFEALDAKGVGRLMAMAVEWGRQARPDLHVGICGEHGGHPESIALCHRIGLDYVSCSAPRVPIARLAAAQARLKEVAAGGPRSDA